MYHLYFKESSQASLFALVVKDYSIVDYMYTWSFEIDYDKINFLLINFLFGYIN